MAADPIDLTAGIAARSKADIHAELRARFKIAESAESMNRGLAIEELKFAAGDQWDDVTLDDRRGRPCPVINHTETFVRRIVNHLKQQRPRIKVHPTGDGARPELAETINGITRHIENLSSADVAYDTAGESAVRIGWGYVRLKTEYIDEKSFDQEIKIDSVRNVFQVYMDPWAKHPTACDARWCLITGSMKRDTYRALYGDDFDEFPDASAGDESLADWDNDETIRLAEYYRIVEKPAKLYLLKPVPDPNAPKTAFESEFASKAEMAKVCLKDRNGQYITRDSFERVVEWHKVNGNKIVDSRQLPGRHIPVVRCEGNVIDLDGQVMRRGVIHDLMDPQRLFNASKAAGTERLFLTPMASWVGTDAQFEGHPEWDDANVKKYSRLPYNHVEDSKGAAIPPPMRQPPAPVEAGFAEAMQSAEHDLVAIAGMPHEPGQDKEGEVVSGVAIQKRQAMSDMSHYQYYDNQTLMIQQVGRIILSWLPAYYDTPRLQRIIGDDGIPQSVPINTPKPPQNGGAGQPFDAQGNPIFEIENDLSIGRYDVVMDTGPGYETKRQEGAEAILSLVGTPELGKKIADVGADLVVRNLDFAGASDLADRLAVTTPQGMESMMQGLSKQGQTVVKTLGAQLQQAQAKIQELEADLKHGLTKTLHQDATKMHIEAMKDKRAEHDTATDAHVSYEDTHTRAQTAISVAEITQAGHMLNTNVEAAHNRVAAQDALEAAERVEKSQGD